MLPLNRVLVDIPMEEYLADPGIGSSSLGYICPPYTPADYKANKDKPYFKGSGAANLGTYIHSAVLEPDTFDDIYIYEPTKFDKRTKAGKDECLKFQEKSEGREIIPFSDRAKIEAAVKAVDDHDELCDILMNGTAEVTGVSNVAKHIIPGGLRFKTREDFLCNDGNIFDIKTLSEAPTDRGLSRVIQKYNYHFKAVHHMEVMRRCGVNVKSFGWIFITTHLPVCHVVVRILSRDMLETAERMHSEAIAQLAHCAKRDVWPGYSQKIEAIDLPTYTQEKSK